jgi:hypothetical protein
MELKHNVYAKQGGDTKRIWDLQLQAAQAVLTQAQAELKGAQQYYYAQLDMRTNPLTLEAQLHGTEMQYDSTARRCSTTWPRHRWRLRKRRWMNWRPARPKKR